MISGQNLAKLFFIIFFVALSPITFAGGVGTSCNYYSNGDSQCDPQNGIYCTMYTCQSVSDTNIYCTDTDANNLTTSGPLSARQRSYDGSFMTINVGDDCLNENTFVPSCTGSLCNVREATCTGQSTYTFTPYQCNACSNGACTSGQYTQGPLGKSCDYSINGDSQCDPQNGIYCESYMCRNVADANTYCTDPDANNLTTAATVNSRARDYAGTFLNNSNADNCILGNSFVSSCTGSNCFIREVTCNANNTQAFNTHQCNSCSNGACTSQSPGGPSCNYYTNGDAQCPSGTYCVGGTCSIVTDTTLSCTDPDANNLTTSGPLTSRQRNYDGNWANIIVGDDCVNGNTFSTSCSGTSCHVREATCTTGANYTFSTYDCLSCQSGACTSGEYSAQDSNTIGRTCLYTSLQDSQCSPDQNIFCIANICTKLGQNNTTFCVDSDHANPFAAGTLSFRHRNMENGSFVSGTRPDLCRDSNRMMEYLCKPTDTTGYTTENINCAIGCLQGACIQPIIPDINAHCINQAKDFDENGIDCGGAYCTPCNTLPDSISDEELLSYISKWGRSEVTNDTLLLTIDIWKNNARPE